ncbi:2-keto-3-deoxygluconate permease [Peribacillus frigoritolerans]|uniref:2-keto-3-deoxygluconate permease n=1 Tax=Peribacillus frigoritolerans TaxID=450367 RepID=UPI00345CBF56
MIILGVGGLATFPRQTIVSTLIPFAVGMIVGNIDKECREFFGQAVPVLIPFFALALGFGLDFGMIVKSGFMGILMGVAVGRRLISTGPLRYWLRWCCWGRRFFNGGCRSCCILHHRRVKPAIRFCSRIATAIIATSVLVTAILTPMLTMWCKETGGKRHSAAKRHETNYFERSKCGFHTKSGVKQMKCKRYPKSNWGYYPGCFFVMHARCC